MLHLFWNFEIGSFLLLIVNFVIFLDVEFGRYWFYFAIP